PLVVVVRPGPFLVAAFIGWSISWFLFVPPRASLQVQGPIQLVIVGLYGVGLAAAGTAAWLSRWAQGRVASGENARVRLAAIVEASDDAIISKSLDGTIQSWNGGAERLFGYTAEEAIGRSITLIIP